jgi:agmatinase
MLKPNPETFLGCDKDYENAGVVLFGAPFDSTASFRPGARFAGGAMRRESWGLETYSPYQDRDMAETAVFDAGELPLSIGDAAQALLQIEEFASRILDDGKLPVMVGGEHLVTLGTVRAAAKRFGNLHILHFDAHADLRDEYLGLSLSHATVMRRVWDIVGNGKISQFGIRSGDRSEFAWAPGHVEMHKFGLDGLDTCLLALRGKKVYFSLDLDILDPAVFPGTGTPEPGGVGFSELLGAVIKTGGLDLVGCDVTELCPVYDPSGASTAAACKLLRELLLAVHNH